MSRSSFTVPMPRPGDGTKIYMQPDGSLRCSWDNRMAMDASPDDQDNLGEFGDGWAAIFEILRNELNPDSYTKIEGLIGRELLSGPEHEALQEQGAMVSKPTPVVEDEPPNFRGMPKTGARTGARDAGHKWPLATDRRPGLIMGHDHQAIEEFVRRSNAKQRQRDAAGFAERWPEAAKRARVV